MCKGKNNISLKRLLKGLNERMGLKCLVQCLTHTVGAEHVVDYCTTQGHLNWAEPGRQIQSRIFVRTETGETQCKHHEQKSNKKGGVSRRWSLDLENGSRQNLIRNREESPRKCP